MFQYKNQINKINYVYILNYIIKFTNNYTTMIGLFGLIGLYTKPYSYTAAFKNDIHSVYLVR